MKFIPANIFLFASLSILAQETLAQETVKPPTPSLHLQTCDTFPAGPDAHAILCLNNGKMRGYAPIGSMIALKPVPPPGTRIMRLVIAVNNRIVRQEEITDSRTLETYYLKIAPVAETSRRNVVVFIVDDTNQRITLIEATLFAREAPSPPKFTTKIEKERMYLTLADRKALGNIYVYINEEGIGKLDENASTDFDLRQLSPGTHKTRLVAENSDGDLLPSVEAEFVVSPRVKLEILEPKMTYFVSLTNQNMGLPVRVLRSDDCTAKKTRLYIAGELVGEYVPNKLDVSVSLRDVPSGKVELEAVVVGEDGVESPGETLEITLKNEGWENRTYSTPTYHRILENLPFIEKAEKEAQSWIARAKAEPAYQNYVRTNTRTVTDNGRVTTVEYLDTVRLPGKAGEYWATARTAVVEEAQYHLKNADLYRALKMKEAAKREYRRAILLAGSNTSTGSAAKAGLDSLNKERRTLKTQS